MPVDATILFEKLRRGLRRVTLDGRERFVIEGDLLVDENELLAWAARRTAGGVEAAAAFLGEERKGLLGIVDSDGRLVRWDKELVLTYAVLRHTFEPPARYYEVVQAMARACADWESICGVIFEHRVEADEVPANAAAGPDVVFKVRQVDAGGAFYAVAFFPTHPAAERVLRIDGSYFSPNLRYDRVGVLRHELGHVLGFRHEHIRSGAPPGCPHESVWETKELTGYDPRSVMHYFCGGLGSKSLEFTELDRDGARQLYGPPKREGR